jgi:hypothetical protein
MKRDKKKMESYLTRKPVRTNRPRQHQTHSIDEKIEGISGENCDEEKREKLSKENRL